MHMRMNGAIVFHIEYTYIYLIIYIKNIIHSLSNDGHTYKPHDGETSDVDRPAIIIHQ